MWATFPTKVVARAAIASLVEVAEQVGEHVIHQLIDHLVQLLLGYLDRRGRGAPGKSNRLCFNFIPKWIRHVDLHGDPTLANEGALTCDPLFNRCRLNGGDQSVWPL